MLGIHSFILETQLALLNSNSFFIGKVARESGKIEQDEF